MFSTKPFPLYNLNQLSYIEVYPMLNIFSIYLKKLKNLYNDPPITQVEQADILMNNLIMFELSLAFFRYHNKFISM
jgi:hypothetical protein